MNNLFEKSELKLSKDISIKYNVVIKEENMNTVVFWSNKNDQNTEMYLKILFEKNVIFEICSDYELSNYRERFYDNQDMSLLKESIRSLNFKYKTINTSVDSQEDSEIVRFLNSIIDYAINNYCSDIHIDSKSSSSLIRVRKDGILNNLVEINTFVSKLLLNRIKILSNLDYTIKNKPQDGRFSYNTKFKSVDIRVAISPTSNSEKVVLRILNKSLIELTKEGIGLNGNQMKIIDTIIRQPNGLILVCGPTGSGKTSTLYTLLKSINNSDINIMTVEDPVEYKIDGINQIEINHKVGMDFNAGLKTILRLDPDKIMLGEIRDIETAETALRAAITGHLVLSTLHTNDSPSAVYRLRDMGIDNYLISAGVVGIISQRLVRKLCKCKVKVKKYVDIYSQELEFFESNGCPICNGSGYMGRKAVFEILVINDNIREKITEDLSITRFKKICTKEGMLPLKESMKELLLKGDTSLEEIYKNIVTIGEL